MLPGVDALAAATSTARIRIMALMAYDPEAILIEAAAASVSFWPDIKVVKTVTCAVRHRRQPQRGYAFIVAADTGRTGHRTVGLRYTSAAFTALDLCEDVGGDAIDQALRTRRLTLPQLHRAMDLTAARVGNLPRRRLLLDSRDEPWSAAERLLHRLLRSAGITWVEGQPERSLLPARCTAPMPCSADFA